MLYYFGDGSDGALNVTSGTHNLPLNTVHQFTNVTIDSGATLSTTSTTGSVLFIAVQDTFTLNGTINLSGKVDPGSNTWGFTVDDTTWYSPGVAAGGYYSGTSSDNKGFGGGGAAGGINAGGAGTAYGGAGGAGGAGITSGGGGSASRSTSGVSLSNGIAGTNSGGGGGAAAAVVADGLPPGAAYANAYGGAGASTYGGNGSNGSGNGGNSGGWTGGWGWTAIGGGGGGGLAGRSGVHLIVRAKTIVLNGTIITSGTAAGNGGNGGRSYDQNGPLNAWGDPGLGGGGGNGGNINLFYADTLTNTATRQQGGGLGGTHGYGFVGYVQPTGPTRGTSGTSGGLTTKKLTPSEYASRLETDSAEATFEVGQPTMTPGAVTLTPDSTDVAVQFGSAVIQQNMTLEDSIDVLLEAGDGIVITQGDPPPPGELDWTNLGTENKKEFLYKVYKPDGTPIGVWDDVRDDPEFSQPINTPGTTMTVILSRSANKMTETREPWVDHTGDPYVDSTGDPYVIVGQTSNTVGEDTDVKEGYLVDVYAFYGGYEEWVDHLGNPYVDHNGDPYILSVGAPMGERIFSGEILDYDATYGDSSSVTVTLNSNGMELSKEVVRSGTTTTISYSTQPIETILKNVIDTNPGKMHWSNDSISATGVSITTKFQLNTKLEAAKSLYDQTPAGWYWYGDVGENLIYLKQASTEADHVFFKGKHIKEVSIKRSMENLINTVYFLGGDTGGGTILYKKYEDAASIAEFGVKVHRITDRRVTLAATAQRKAEKMLSLYSQPIYTTTVTISSGTYPIESVKLGQMVRFGNFGNFTDSLLLQIVNRNYTPRAVTLQLGGLLDRQVDTVSNLEEGLQNEQFQEIPNAPS